MINFSKIGEGCKLTWNVPKLKFHATNYYHMIDWDTEVKTELPFLTSLSDEKVLGILEKSLSVPK